MGPLRLALLISGSGTTAEAIVKAIFGKKLPNVNLVVAVSSRLDAEGVKKLTDMGVKVFVVCPRDFEDQTKFGIKLLEIFRTYKVDLVSQNGWLPLTPVNVVRAFRGRIINQHPGPLDLGRCDFGGKGMYGARVTCARLAYTWITDAKKPWTESTVHHVTEDYDKGNVIRISRMQLPRPNKQKITLACLERDPTDLIRSTKEAQRKLLAVEWENVISVLKKISEGKQNIKFTRRWPLINPKHKHLLPGIKELAIKLFPAG